MNYDELMSHALDKSETNKQPHMFHAGVRAIRVLKHITPIYDAPHMGETGGCGWLLIGYEVKEDITVHDDLIVGIDRKGNILFTINTAGVR